MNVVHAIIAAHGQDIDLDFDRRQPLTWRDAT